MKQLNLGILAHVDAGKTTLSEALLFEAGQLRKLGRVDHGDAFLDTDALERERGITILSKQARLEYQGVAITLVDTPGHVDFSGEAERALSVLDCAVLVISGTSGIQSHTLTLWRLLERYRVPTFVFVNKMDLPGVGREGLMDTLRDGLSGGCADFSLPREQLDEQAALADEDVLNRYLEEGGLSDDDLRGLIAERKLFPCFFGAALKMDGVAALLQGLCAFGPESAYGDDFAASVYKISRDAQGARLTWLKVTGGELRVKMAIPDGDDPDAPLEKVDQIRLYSGERFTMVPEVPAGTVCAVTGLTRTRPGQGLGAAAAARAPALTPVLSYQVLLPQGFEPHTALLHLRQLEEEDPNLHVRWHEQTRQIDVRLMGEVQREVLARRLADRFSLAVEFGPGTILYAETLAAPVVGVGHFEPLRHYSEVHVLMEPLPRGSGLEFGSLCSTDVFPGNWQRLVLTHMAERSHPGALTGSPLTDVRITLIAGAGHVQYTAGGDFRQATYRAIRQGLMEAENILLEPWYDLRLEIPSEQVGRAMSDIRRMLGRCGDAEPLGDGKMSRLSGTVPVSRLGDYAREVTAYSRGLGHIGLSLGGYFPCHEQAEVVERLAYSAEQDLDNTPDSVFCAKGTSYIVGWRDAKRAMHIPPISPPKLAPPEPEPEKQPAPVLRAYAADTRQQDRELQAIFERTYGPIRQRDILPLPQRQEAAPSYGSRPRPPECLLVDGYNILFAWPQLKKIAEDSIDTARTLLCDLLCNYQAMRGCAVIVVFDAYKVARSTQSVLEYHNIHIVYTKEAETADAFIEKTTYELSRRFRVRVATSDSAEQLIILSHGAQRVTAEHFYEEVLAIDRQLAEVLEAHERKAPRVKLKDLMENV